MSRQHELFRKGMFEGLFDIKNDRRLSIYLYRAAIVIWGLYLLAGAPVLLKMAEYRTPLGLLSALMLVLSFAAHMVYEYVHHRAAYQLKKKWLFIGTIFAAVLIYVMEFGAPSLPQLWIKVLTLLD